FGLWAFSADFRTFRAGTGWSYHSAIRSAIALAALGGVGYIARTSACPDPRTCAMRQCIGAWLSLVEHLVRDEGVAGSNPAAPTMKSMTCFMVRRPPAQKWTDIIAPG